jgi:hypothetical protein
MNEPWINNPGMVGDTLVSVIGVIGLVMAILVLILIPKGKAKNLVLGVYIFGIVLSFIPLVIGIVAYLSGQPRSIWWSCFGYPGLLGTPLFTMFFFGSRHEYRKAELRKSMAEDLTLGGNNDDQQN